MTQAPDGEALLQLFLVCTSWCFGNIGSNLDGDLLASVLEIRVFIFLVILFYWDNCIVGKNFWRHANACFFGFLFNVCRQPKSCLGVFFLVYSMSSVLSLKEEGLGF